MSKIFGYQARKTPIHELNAVAKLVYFLVTTVVVMTTYDPRLVLLITGVSLVGLRIARVQWESVSFVIKFIIFFSVLNLVTIFLLAPQYGEQLYGSRTVLIGNLGRYDVTAEQLFYELNILIKYFATVPLVLVFMLSMNPSDFAASLNRIGIPYRVAYAVSLTLRYIPDVQRDFFNIRNAQAARGVALDQKQSLWSKVKQVVKLAMPLILTSFERIDTISQAMLLRRFGHGRKRTWYTERPMKRQDYIVIGLSLVWVVALCVMYWHNQGRFYNPFR